MIYFYDDYKKNIDAVKTRKDIKTVLVHDGLTIDQINKIATRPAKAVIFDWNRTISLYKEMTPDFAGSKERLVALQNMFKTLREKGTRIVILTANPAGKNPIKFSKTVKIVYPREIKYGKNKLKVINRLFTRKIKF